MSSAAALMDSMYRRQRHIYDVSRKFYLLGRDDLIRELQPPAGGRVLEIGCGTARNLILAAKTYPSAHFFGVDVSQEMLTSARASIEKSGLATSPLLARGDATNFDPRALFGHNDFDRIMIPYALSMIPPWRETLAHALDVLAPNGSLHIVDFGDFSGLPDWFSAAMHRWLAAFSVHPRQDLEDCITALAAQRGARVRVLRRFRGYAVHAIVVTPAGPGAIARKSQSNKRHLFASSLSARDTHAHEQQRRAS